MIHQKSFIPILTIFCLLTALLQPIKIYAEEELPWPAGPEIAAGSAILMDADSGMILYEKNSHERHYPASITKIMTALLTLENCELDEVVTYSRDAVFSIEPGSNHIALNPGDQLTVEESLYGLLLASANEVANGLGEHIAGSMDEFAVMMTERAGQLGCTDTNFTNANGLHDDNHYTSCYDMALITREALKSPIFRKIDSTITYVVPKETPLPIVMGHKMLNPRESVYYAGCMGGKTGYTTRSGNTLVTYAERNGLRLISVVMNCNGTHYTDTTALLDFGFANFEVKNISQNDTRYILHADSRLDFLSLEDSSIPLISLNSSDSVLVPAGTDFSSLRSEINYHKGSEESGDTLADITYYYGDLAVGTTSLILNTKASQEFVFTKTAETTEAVAPREDDVIFINVRLIIATVIVVIAVILFIIWWFKNDTPRNRRERNWRKFLPFGKGKSGKLRF